MQSIPQRQSLVSQTVTVLRNGIADGTWRDWLPSERALCQQLQVSRNTLRTALNQLQRAKLVRAEHGAGTRILTTTEPSAPALPAGDVALLSPDPLEQLRPTQTLWIDALRAMLGERGCRLHVFHGRQYFRSNPGPALQKLLAQHPHGCWILTLPNEAIQHWFSEHEVPCVVAGSVHGDLALPSRDLDHRAMCRHAAGIMLGLGHRQLAIVIAQSRLAGDLESEAGFIDGVRMSPHPDAEAIVCKHDGTVPGIGHSLRRLFERAKPPTALLVANAYHYLAVVGRLAQLGRRVPYEVTVISRDEDPFLSFMMPAPARYIANPQSLAKSLLEPVLDLLAGRAVTKPTLRLMPDFFRGETLGPPPPVVR
ncbi:MAG: GntR family transcriptional regulator [Opitutae bacterium]|nr:GntR family transcriptional regulator [Opitutae bacterium]